MLYAGAVADQRDHPAIALRQRDAHWPPACQPPTAQYMVKKSAGPRHRQVLLHPSDGPGASSTTMSVGRRKRARLQHDTPLLSGSVAEPPGGAGAALARAGRCSILQQVPSARRMPPTRGTFRTDAAASGSSVSTASRAPGHVRAFCAARHVVNAGAPTTSTRSWPADRSRNRAGRSRKPRNSACPREAAARRHRRREHAGLAGFGQAHDLFPGAVAVDRGAHHDGDALTLADRVTQRVDHHRRPGGCRGIRRAAAVQRKAGPSRPPAPTPSPGRAMLHRRLLGAGDGQRHVLRARAGSMQYLTGARQLGDLPREEGSERCSARYRCPATITGASGSERGGRSRPSHCRRLPPNAQVDERPRCRWPGA